MFFDDARILAMRQMILAGNADGRRAALAKILPIQRRDFVELFEIMGGLPVTIRLLDPPLHEFLPHEPRRSRRSPGHPGSMASAAAARRQLREVNPMLGLRGCRLGVLFPEIYEMQARHPRGRDCRRAALGRAVEPEVMVPLISDARRARHDQAGDRHRRPGGDRREGAERWPRRHHDRDPRATLQAAEIAEHAEFFSFGTNDLTQMALGLSRDDCGQVPRAPICSRASSGRPVHHARHRGVGALVEIACERGRRGRPD